MPMRPLAFALIVALTGCAANHPAPTQPQTAQSIAQQQPTAAPTATEAATPVGTPCPDTGAHLMLDQTQVAPAAGDLARSLVRLDVISNDGSCQTLSGTVILEDREHFIVITVGKPMGGVLRTHVIPWPQAEMVDGTILGYDTSPNLAVISFTCAICQGHITPAIIATQPPARTPLVIAGYTLGSNQPLAHPARMGDAGSIFDNLETTFWAYTMVSGAPESGDGLFTARGGFIGLLVESEPDPLHNNVLRDLYLPAQQAEDIASQLLGKVPR